jgi:hypothetical protein
LPGIFINYRREDSGGYAQQIYKALRSHFGAKLVFMDIDTIRSGEDYRAIIREAIAQSDVFLAVIGRTWLRCTDDKGIARLSYPADLVRREIAQALEANIQVVPVLVGHAQMPRAADLPGDLKTLAARNAHEIPDHFFDQSVRQLIRTIRPYVRGHREISRRAVVGSIAGTVAVGLAGVIVTEILDHPRSDPAQAQAAAATTKFGEIQSLIDNSAKQPRVVVRKPNNAEILPAEVPGPWKIDRIDFSSQVTGPHQEPKVVWVARVSIGDAWKLIGFAPDRTLYIYDEEHRVICAIRDGVEQWAYEADDVRALTHGGLIVLRFGPLISNPDAFICFNSRGEGGTYKRPAKLPQNLVSLQEVSYDRSPGRCEAGSVTLTRSKTVISADGNCAGWGVIQDDRGRLYSGTDRGILYCFDTDGKILWTYKAEVELQYPPLFSLGDPVFAEKDHLICLRDGAQRWSVPLESCSAYLVDKIGTVFVTSASPVVLGYHSQHTLSAVDHDGHLLWSTPMAGQPAMFDPEGRLYMTDSSRDFVICLA